MDGGDSSAGNNSTIRIEDRFTRLFMEDQEGKIIIKL